MRNYLSGGNLDYSEVAASLEEVDDSDEPDAAFVVDCWEAPASTTPLDAVDEDLLVKLFFKKL
eukprot:CAMPEP_0176341706 /NCGR_PEP_ID=MMETSP0126-20121128/2592_1 /TAXON_ID=141414 ORGANISM="Strombidinopsis acuminatum, Strain SPMC142" /NCGR_SAMPLE_ID=MMETSP0126 /ASSEMBLY_ACC=CAM_ASM_000229 /LENGTH=62 /DNA_ID=CAMNT_0017686683 /DNA_START=136 /DNA_END=324 /DNA_ORIENTATION=+